MPSENLYEHLRGQTSSDWSRFVDRRDLGDRSPDSIRRLARQIWMFGFLVDILAEFMNDGRREEGDVHADRCVGTLAGEQILGDQTLRAGLRLAEGSPAPRRGLEIQTGCM